MSANTGFKPDRFTDESTAGQTTDGIITSLPSSKSPSFKDAIKAAVPDDVSNIYSLSSIFENTL